MKKSDWQYVVDTLLFLCIVAIALIGFLMGFFLPKGPLAREASKYFLGLHRHQWGNIHFYLSIAFVALVIIHLTLSWKWIKGKARQLFKNRWAVMLGSTAAASLLILFLFWILYPKVPGAYEDYGTRAKSKARHQELMEEGFPHPEETVFYRETKEKIEPQEKQVKKEEAEHEEKLTRGRMSEDVSGILITGQMTLLDIENKTGIPARKIADKLGLPLNIPLNERIGRLRRRYLFTMQEVRDVIASLMKK
jgi:hypothetical protein